VKARGRQVVMSCNTANYHKLYRIVDFRYRPRFLWEMKYKDRYFAAFYKLLVKSLKMENGIYIYTYIYRERERERQREREREKIGFVLRSDVHVF